jgi:hypothetical protein
MCTTLHLDGLKRHASVITPIKKAWKVRLQQMVRCRVYGLI